MTRKQKLIRILISHFNLRSKREVKHFESAFDKMSIADLNRIYEKWVERRMGKVN